MIGLEEKILGYLNEFLGIEEGSTAEEVIDIGLSAAPYLAKVYNAFKLRRFDKRIKENEEQIVRIKQKMNTLDEPLKEMIQNTIFPYILDDLIEEHQDRKIEFILYGSEYIVYEEVEDQDYIISYYDVLRDLRIEDIKRLLEYKLENKIILESRKRKSRDYLNRIDNDTYREVKEEMDKFFEEEAYRKHIDYKLESKGLIGNNRKRHNEALLQLIDKLDERNRQRMSLNNSNSDYTIMDLQRFKSTVKKEIEYELTSFGYTLIKTFNLRIED